MDPFRPYLTNAMIIEALRPNMSPPPSYFNCCQEPSYNPAYNCCRDNTNYNPAFNCCQESFYNPEFNCCRDNTNAIKLQKEREEHGDYTIVHIQED